MAVARQVGPATDEPVDRAGLAADVVRRMAHVTAALRHRQDSAFAELGLTPAAARALRELDPDRPLPARDLAGQLGCDRSNVTVLVDKLEQAGLVERRTDPADRRQKTLVVTEDGPRRAGPGDRGDVRLPTPVRAERRGAEHPS